MLVRRRASSASSAFLTPPQIPSPLGRFVSSPATDNAIYHVKKKLKSLSVMRKTERGRRPLIMLAAIWSAILFYVFLSSRDNSAAMAIKHSIVATFHYPSSLQPTLSDHRDPRRQYNIAKDGLLHYPLPLTTPLGVNETARAVVDHPLRYLIDEAERTWNAKLSRQSRNLRNAVLEYRRRYGRNPPHGFDKWWWFAKSRTFLLPDEFDVLTSSFTPFLALPPAVLRSRLLQLRTDPDSSFHGDHIAMIIRSKELFGFTDAAQAPTVRKLAERPNSPALAKQLHNIVGLTGSKRQKGDDLKMLTKQFLEFFSGFVVMFSSRGRPNVLVTEADRMLHVNAGRRNEELSPDKVVLESSDALPAWLAVCTVSKKDPVEQSTDLSNRDTTTSEVRSGSFVVSPLAVSDMCANPDVQSSLDYVAASGPQFTPLFPYFTTTSTSIHSDLPWPDVNDIREYPPEFRTEWSDKSEVRLLWRGNVSETALPRSQGWEWRQFWNTQRTRLVRLGGTSERQSSQTIRYSYNATNETEPTFTEGRFSAETLSEHYLDVGFNEPAECADEDWPGCTKLHEVFHFPPAVNQSEAARYKYVMDVDGGEGLSHSDEFRALLDSSSLVLKSTVYREWWNDHIQPYYHYVPVNPDLSDVFDIMAFFRGPPLNGSVGNDGAAVRIAANGKEFVARQWRMEDLEVYAFRAMLEWSRLMRRTDVADNRFDFVMTL